MRQVLTVCVLTWTVAIICGCSGMLAQPAPSTYQNPILPGFFPDPSLCRVGDTYYLVNSSFEWFPGVPVHRSKDLVNWELIGYAIDRIGQLNHLNIWAPTIRYHEGLFYMITTERPGMVFYVTAQDPAGPWSDPVYVPIDPQQVSAIDPSLYWDDDGTCWFAANDRRKSGTIKHWVWIQKIDLKPNAQGKASFIGERRYITKGSGVGPDNFTEGPHIFKYKGMYFLLIAEGGTWDKHAMSVLRTHDLNAPVEEWEYCPDNPILTHRDKKSPISATGHADFVDTQNGQWWSTHLGVRKRDGKHKLGRETFLVPILWQPDGEGGWWPAYNPNRKHMTHMEEQRPQLPWTPLPQIPARDEFEGPQLGLQWNFYNEPHRLDWFSLTESRGALRIQLRPQQATDTGHCGFIGRRQQQHNFDVITKLTFDPETPNEVAGLMATIKNNHHVRLEIGREGQKTTATLYCVKGGQERQTGQIVLTENDDTFYLKLEARDWDFQFYAGTTENDLHPVGGIQDARILSSEIAKGFTGSYVGMYASSQGSASEKYADFEWFEYVPRVVNATAQHR